MFQFELPAAVSSVALSSDAWIVVSFLCTSDVCVVLFVRTNLKSNVLILKLVCIKK